MSTCFHIHSPRHFWRPRDMEESSPIFARLWWRMFGRCAMIDAVEHGRTLLPEQWELIDKWERESL